jgi:hypothetical protein
MGLNNIYQVVESGFTIYLKYEGEFVLDYSRQESPN